MGDMTTVKVFKNAINQYNIDEYAQNMQNRMFHLTSRDTKTVRRTSLQLMIFCNQPEVSTTSGSKVCFMFLVTLTIDLYSTQTHTEGKNSSLANPFGRDSKHIVVCLHNINFFISIDNCVCLKEYATSVSRKGLEIDPLIVTRRWWFKIITIAHQQETDLVNIFAIPYHYTPIHSDGNQHLINYGRPLTYRVSQTKLTTLSFAHIYANHASIATYNISREIGQPPVSLKS